MSVQTISDPKEEIKKAALVQGNGPTATVETKSIPLAQVEFIQIRVLTDKDKVEEYSDLIKAGVPLPEVRAFWDGQTYFIADGQHRGEAHTLLGRTEIQAKVSDGTRRDAVLYAVAANHKHGIPRTHDDKHNAVRTLLRDPEWRQWSKSEVARRCNVSDDLVDSIIERESEFAELRSQTIKKVKRKGKEISMDTSGIGGAKNVSEPKSKIENTTSKDKASADDAKVENENVSQVSALLELILLCERRVANFQEHLNSSLEGALTSLRKTIEIRLEGANGGKAS